MKTNLLNLLYKLGLDLIFGLVAAVLVHFAVVGLAPSLITRVTALVGNTGTSIEINANEFISGYDKSFDAEAYANAIAKEKQAEIERRQISTESMKNSLSEIFSTLNCFIILFGIRFVVAYIMGSYNVDIYKTKQLINYD